MASDDGLLRVQPRRRQVDPDDGVSRWAYVNPWVVAAVYPDPLVADRLCDDGCGPFAWMTRPAPVAVVEFVSGSHMHALGDAAELMRRVQQQLRREPAPPAAEEQPATADRTLRLTNIVLGAIIGYRERRRRTGGR